eukprot:TRINITY_DN4539_c0_g1_i7.p1 TRINITY_DN4539_c0_g1~~TRINITY_DN4539_c0_g1_i7.p1  ORF type:complete len:421 (-),score=88.62 TRINITY_DN4539_c0_g1_i7:615-1877(-)
MLIVMCVSSLASTMLCQAMSRMPGNDKFQGRAEFSSLAKFLLPRWAYIITTVLVVISLMAYLISSIIISAQTMDLTLIAIFKKTYAIEFYPHPGWTEVTNPGTETSPFGNSFVLSLGYVIVLVLTVPMGYFNLDDNIIIQKGAVFMLILIFIEWFVNFFLVGIDFKRVPIAAANQSQVLGSIIFNYAFVITVPSWVNEKAENVSISKSVWTATGTATVFYILIGLLGAWAFDFAANQDLLDVIVLHSTGPLRLISRICVYLFPAAALLSSIPVFSIIIRYNLTDNGIVKRKIIANWWSVIFPWILGVVVYTGSGVISVINWTSLFVNGVVNFVIPLILYILSNRIPYEDEKRPIDINDGQEDRIALLKDKPTTYFKALPDRKWLNHNAVAYTLIVVITLFLLAVIVTDFVYLGLGVNLVG